MGISLKKLNDGENIKSDDLIKQIYNVAVEDRERALRTFERLNELINPKPVFDPETGENVAPEVRLTGIIMQEINQAQNAIRMATDKLVQVANLLNRKESSKILNEINMTFDNSLLEDDKESFEERRENLGVSKN